MKSFLRQLGLTILAFLCFLFFVAIIILSIDLIKSGFSASWLLSRGIILAAMVLLLVVSALHFRKHKKVFFEMLLQYF